MYQITIETEDGETTSFECGPNEDVISAGLRQSVILLSSCRAGGCATCKGDCTEGDYELIDVKVQALPPDEEEDGKVLLCRTYGTVDLLADYPFDYDGWKINAGVNIHNLFDRTYYTSASLEGPITGLAGSYGGRSYGDNFSVLGHISAQWPGSPPAPSKTPAPAMSWVHDWSGPYAGLQVGMGWGNNDGNFSYITPDGFSGSPPFITNSYGVLAGAHLGYNRQYDRWVLGLEGSVDVTDLNRHEQLGWSNPDPAAYYSFYGYAFCAFGACGGAIDTHIQSDIQGSLRARVGYAWNRLLLYGTGGLALANFNLQSNIGGQDSFGNFYFAAANDRSTVRAGWTGGAGVEYAITNHWSARAEYRYSDFGHISETPTSFSMAGLYYEGDRHVTQQQVQVGVSYKFGGVEPELVPVAAPIVKGPALAADLPALKDGAAPSSQSAALAINWTGFYIGGQAGYAYGDNHGAYNLSTPSGVVGSGALSHDAQGVIFGAHVGYNHQFDNFVAGLEGSVDGTSMIKRETIGASDANGDNAIITSLVQSDIQGAVRARGICVRTISAVRGRRLGHRRFRNTIGSRELERRVGPL
jgi:outer membrane immunogenic protein